MAWSGVLGFLIGSVTVTLLQALLPADAMESYGWRIPFLLAGPLGLVGLYIRLRLDDTPQFAELSKDRAGRQVAAAGGGHHVVAVDPAGDRPVHRLQRRLLRRVHVPADLPHQDAEVLQDQAFVSITLASLVALVLILPLAALSDRIGRQADADRRFAGVRDLRLSAVPAAELGLAGRRDHGALRAGGDRVRLRLARPSAAGVELFATRVRYSGFSIGYNICVAAFGGTTPYVVTWLTAQTGNNVAPAYYS